MNNEDYNHTDNLTELLFNRDEKLIDMLKELKEENERLKELYIKTCKHLFNIGNDELARYFQAQINECNVFIPQDLGGENNE